MTTRVTIGVCTYRRPEGLAALFRSLVHLEVPPDTIVRVVIVDNDKSPSARTSVAELAAILPFSVSYAHEDDPGIPQARNRVLDEACGADFLLFVDDDETVANGLLREHLRVQGMTGADFVQGPCNKTVEDPRDRWWLDTGFFRDRTFEDGAPRHESWTNNVLINIRFVESSGVRFDDRLRFAGGTDTLFFQDIVRCGGRGAFAAHALVYEVQQKSRLTWRWALSRQYRYGVTRANSRLLRERYLRAFLWCMVRAAGMKVVGLAHLGSALYRGRRGLADGLALIARGAGVASGALGFRAEEYRRT